MPPTDPADPTSPADPIPPTGPADPTPPTEERSPRQAGEPIRVVAYDPRWPERFAAEAALLEEAIGPWVISGIHHIGSTAVPGLDAKPIIDILAGVRSLEQAKACFDPLAGLEYLYAPYLSDEMHWFCKPSPDRRTHHLHLVPIGSRRYRDELAFRNRLRANPQIAGDYAALKHSLAERFRDDREAYTEGKSDFVRTVLAAPDVDGGSGVTDVRRATREDVEAIAGIHVRSWQAAYRGILPDELLDSLSVSEQATSWRVLVGSGEEHRRTLVAESGGELAGFCSVATRSRDADADDETAEIGALYVDPDNWRRGVGTALLTSALEELSQAGLHDVVLWVLPENRAALAFYAGFGFRIEEGVEKREERSGRPVIRLRAAVAQG